MLAIPTHRRRRSAAAAVAALGALLLAGCSLSTSEDNAPRLAVQLLTATMPPEGEPPEVNVNSGARFIQAQGTLVLPCQSAGRDARHDVSGTVLTLRMIITSTSACDAGPAVPLGYNAFLTNVPANTYTFRVVYEGDVRVEDGTVVHEESVVVTPSN